MNVSGHILNKHLCNCSRRPYYLLFFKQNVSYNHPEYYQAVMFATCCENKYFHVTIPWYLSEVIILSFSLKSPQYLFCFVMIQIKYITHKLNT